MSTDLEIRVSALIKNNSNRNFKRNSCGVFEFQQENTLLYEIQVSHLLRGT